MISVGVEITSYLIKSSSQVLNDSDQKDWTDSLIMWGCRRVRMYSNSLLTRVLVFSRRITAFDMYFIATLWPVIVCLATDKILSCYLWQHNGDLPDILLTLPKVPSAMSRITVYSPSFEGGSLPWPLAIVAVGYRWECLGLFGQLEHLRYFNLFKNILACPTERKNLDNFRGKGQIRYLRGMRTQEEGGILYYHVYYWAPGLQLRMPVQFFKSSRRLCIRSSCEPKTFKVIVFGSWVEWK